MNDDKPNPNTLNISLSIFKLSLFNGVNNRDNHSASLYESMTDNDYTMAALSFFKESLK